MPAPDHAPIADALHPDDSGASVTSALHRAALGPISLGYYLPILTRFEAASRGAPGWNWAACLYTVNWLIFRRMWGAALLYLTVLVCGTLLLWVSDAQAITLWAGWFALCFVVPGVYGNQLLYASTRKKVLRALTDSRTLKEACQKLSLQAASRRSFVWLVLTNMLLVSALVAGYLAFSDHDAPTPTPTPTPAQAPIPVPASAPAPASALSVSTSPAVAPATTEPVRTAFTKDELQALDAAALRYVPRRPLPVSDVASAPVVVASQAAARAPASSPPLGAIYYINVGLFANDWNARYAQAKLVDAGFVSFRQAVMSAKGKLTRVRVGPFESQAQADAAAEKIHELKLDAVVFRQ